MSLTVEDAPGTGDSKCANIYAPIQTKSGINSALPITTSLLPAKTLSNNILAQLRIFNTTPQIPNLKHANPNFNCS